jgi:hypothetical protein
MSANDPHEETVTAILDELNRRDARQGQAQA